MKRRQEKRGVLRNTKNPYETFVLRELIVEGMGKMRCFITISLGFIGKVRYFAMKCTKCRNGLHKKVFFVEFEEQLDRKGCKILLDSAQQAEFAYLVCQKCGKKSCFSEPYWEKRGGLLEKSAGKQEKRGVLRKKPKTLKSPKRCGICRKYNFRRTGILLVNESARSIDFDSANFSRWRCVECHLF